MTNLQTWHVKFSKKRFFFLCCGKILGLFTRIAENSNLVETREDIMHDDEMVDLGNVFIRISSRHAWQSQGRPESRGAFEYTPAYVDKPQQPEPNQF